MNMIVAPHRFAVGGGAPPVQTSGLFSHGYSTTNFALGADHLGLSKWTNLNPSLDGAVWDRMAIRLGASVTNGRKIKLCVYDSGFNLVGQTAEGTLTSADSNTVVELLLQTPMVGPGYGDVYWIGVHIDGALNVLGWAFGSSGGYKHGTNYPYASGLPATFVAANTQNHMLDVWAGITVDYGILGKWQGSAEGSIDDVTFDSAADRMALLKVDVPAGTGATRTIDRIYARVATITAGNKFRPVVYEDDGAGSPGALLAEGAEATVANSGEDLEMTISASITEGQSYWIGIIADGATNLKSQSGGITEYQAHTYANPAPDPANTTGNEVETAAIWARYS